MVKSVKKDLKNPPCEKCNLLATLRTLTDVLLMVTLSPNPRWKEYQNMLPDRQYYNLNKALNDATTIKALKKYFGSYHIIGEHYEFNKAGQLHSHNLISIPKEFAGYQRNCITISKYYHKIIGEQFTNSMIDSHVDFIHDYDQALRYLDKENAYNAIHHEPVRTLVNFFPEEIQPSE